MEKTNYLKYNAYQVLTVVNSMIDKGYRQYSICTVCDELSIFDWWTDNLTQRHLKQMKTFLENAINLGFTGYVCFKVGASGCANGMWAHKEETTTGYSPDGDCLYRSFSPNYTYWSAKINDIWYPSNTNDSFDSCKTIHQLERLLKENNLL